MTGDERDERINRLERDAHSYRQYIKEMEAVIARLKSVACEWEPYPAEEARMKIIAQETFSLGGTSGSRTTAGRLAATLVRFARTGELPC